MMIFFLFLAIEKENLKVRYKPFNGNQWPAMYTNRMCIKGTGAIVLNVVQEEDALGILRCVGVQAINKSRNAVAPGPTNGMMFLTRSHHHDREAPSLNVMVMELRRLNF